jgi:hypothetical protein
MAVRNKSKVHRDASVPGTWGKVDIFLTVTWSRGKCLGLNRLIRMASLINRVKLNLESSERVQSSRSWHVDNYIRFSVLSTRNVFIPVQAGRFPVVLMELSANTIRERSPQNEVLSRNTWTTGISKDDHAPRWNQCWQRCQR